MAPKRQVGFKNEYTFKINCHQLPQYVSTTLNIRFFANLTFVTSVFILYVVGRRGKAALGTGVGTE